MLINEISPQKLRLALDTEQEYFWFLDDRVALDGSWGHFFEYWKENRSDILSSWIRYRYQDKSWRGWHGFRKGADAAISIDDKDIAMFFPIVRLSRRSIAWVAEAIEQRWHGDICSVLPNLVAANGGVIEDLGGDGPFVSHASKAEWYSPLSLSMGGTCRQVDGKIHFPVQPNRLCRPIFENGSAVNTDGKKLLLFSAIGVRSAEFLHSIVPAFESCGARIVLVKYEECEVQPEHQKYVVEDKGGKWNLALKHVGVDIGDKFDYVFVFDDDLKNVCFDPVVMANIMRLNALDVAQPAIVSRHPLSHHIVEAQAPVIIDSEMEIVGRLTTFAEIMAPVFSARGWGLLARCIDPENFSGWGYDRLPLGRTGIIDIQILEHLFPLGSATESAFNEEFTFRRRYGIYKRKPQELGLLFRRREQRRLVHCEEDPTENGKVWVRRWNWLTAESSAHE